MKREEEIKLLVQHLAKVWYAGANSNLEALFVQAVQWADEHPKNPWISVEERLPEIDQTQHTKKKNMSIAVLVHDIEILHDALGQAYSPSVVRYDYERKDWLYVELGCYANEVEIGAEITHWMPIPELKKGE